MSRALLSEYEPASYRVLRPSSSSPLLLTADHASQTIPDALNGLGLSSANRERHIAWDIGISGVTEHLSQRLETAAVLQNYSRLVIDCNRQPTQESAFPAISEDTEVPGNRGLSASDRAARRAAIFDPYHGAISALIDVRTRQEQRTIYIAMHSFTPVYKSISRPMHVGILYARNGRFSRLVGGLLRADGDLTIADNEPYAVVCDRDYGIPVHAECRGLDYVEIEIRQDLIATKQQQCAWASRLARCLSKAIDQLETQ